MKYWKIALATAVAPLLVAAQNPTAGPAPAAGKAKGSYISDIICKEFPPPPGTRIGSRKICKSKGEWDRIDLDQEQVIEEVQKKPFSTR